MKLALGLYAIYFLLVAVKGNANPLFKQLQADAPAFLPWLVVAGVLGAMYEYPSTRSLAGVFILLIVLSFFLKNYTTLATQFQTIYHEATGAPVGPVSTAYGVPGGPLGG